MYKIANVLHAYKKSNLNSNGGTEREVRVDDEFANLIRHSTLGGYFGHICIASSTWFLTHAACCLVAESDLSIRMPCNSPVKQPLKAAVITRVEINYHNKCPRGKQGDRVGFM